jgi:hypothetical protein
MESVIRDSGSWDLFIMDLVIMDSVILDSVILESVIQGVGICSL